MNVTLSVLGTYFYELNSNSIKTEQLFSLLPAPASGSLFYLTLSLWAYFRHLACQHIIVVLLCLVSLTWYVFQIHKYCAIIFFLFVF